MLDFRTAAALRAKAVPITPECPAWRYLVRRGIPDEVIQANAGELLYLEANIPGRPLGEHALVALIRDAGAGAETGFQTSFCGPDGERVARTIDNPDKRTCVLERHGSLKGLFLAGTVAEDGVLCVTEGRAEKALAVAAAGYAAAGYGGRQVLGRQALPPDARTIIVVPDKRPAVRLGADMLKAATRATAHDYDYARGIARLEAAGAVVLRMPDFECDCCKDADDCFHAHGADALREMITRAEPAPKTVVGEVLKLAMISDGALRDQALREAAKALKVGLRELRAAVVKQRRKAARQRREDEATTAPVGQAERQPPFVVVHQAYRTKHGQMRQPGVYYEQTDADGNTVLAWVCSPLEVLGRNRDAASEEWGMLLRVTDPDDNRH